MLLQSKLLQTPSFSQLNPLDDVHSLCCDLVALLRIDNEVSQVQSKHDSVLVKLRLIKKELEQDEAGKLREQIQVLRQFAKQQLKKCEAIEALQFKLGVKDVT